MKFYNIDMHISIIHDIKNIFTDLGHQVDSVCLSGHTWVNNEPKGSTEIINVNNWFNINQDLCDAFYNKYKDELKGYDAFVHSYPPAFALLFERWNKPIITILCTRFEYPCANRLSWLIDGLNRLYKNGLLIPISNNLFDKAYCEKYTNFKWEHISSLCNYMGVEWVYDKKNKIKTWNKSNLNINHEMIDNNFNIRNKYDRDKVITTSMGVIHIPYNISIMSAFEHYYCNIPLFVPSEKFLKSTPKNKYNLLSELYFPEHPLIIDPKWISLSDWYDDNNMPYTIKFDSVEQLYSLIDSTNYLEVSERMKDYNIIRKDRTYKQLAEIINKVTERKL